MRDHSGFIEKERHEAVRDILASWKIARAFEEVDVPDALGRITGEDIYSLNTLPNKLTSNMDGVAVRFADFETGMPDTGAWARGRDWQFCNTGVGMPDDFDTAIRIEDVEVSNDSEHISLHAMPEYRGQLTTPPGASLSEGDFVMPAGSSLTPALLSALNTAGHVRVNVVKKPVVAFIPTGSELVEAGGTVPQGKNVESNAVMACAKFTLWGADPLRYPIIPDDWDAIESTLEDAVSKADIVVINAGSSKGSEDFTCEILEQHGRMLHHMLAQGPGRHCSAAMWEGTPVVGISGPPIGAEFTLDWMVKPLIDRYLGLPGDYPPMVYVRMAEAPAFWPQGVQVVRRGLIERDENDELIAHVLPDDTTRPKLVGLDNANCFITFGRGVEPWEAGQWHPVELRWPYAFPPAM